MPEPGTKDRSPIKPAHLQLSLQIVDLKQLGISTERPQKKLPTGTRTVAFIGGLYEYKSTSCNHSKPDFSVFQHFHNFLV